MLVGWTVAPPAFVAVSTLDTAKLPVMVARETAAWLLLVMLRPEGPTGCAVPPSPLPPQADSSASADAAKVVEMLNFMRASLVLVDRASAEPNATATLPLKRTNLATRRGARRQLPQGEP
jgi:hypothetical protein